LRRTITLVAALAMMLGLFAGTAAAQPRGADVPKHGHMLVLHVEGEEGQETYGKCVDLAGGRHNSHAHHGTVHQGPAGDALERAGHATVPTRGEGPFAGIPWTNCAEFAEVFGPPR
jgi:hypothetical protein